jgi:hypothetical protein
VLRGPFTSAIKIKTEHNTDNQGREVYETSQWQAWDVEKHNKLLDKFEVYVPHSQEN